MTATPIFQSANDPPPAAPAKKPGRPKLRECPSCGGRVTYTDGRLDEHGIHRRKGQTIRETDQRCDGSGSKA